MIHTREYGFFAGGLVIGISAIAIVLLQTPIGASVYGVRSAGTDASDDIGVPAAVVVQEAPAAAPTDVQPDGLIAETPAPRAEDARRVVGGVPEQVAKVSWPSSLDARNVTAASPLRTTATNLFARVVPDAIARGASDAEERAAIAFIALGPDGVDDRDPCVTIGAGERAALLDAYVRTQGALPEQTTDYQFTCSLVTNPDAPIDITKQFPDHRRIDLEPLALRTFTRFFGRLPSQNASGEPLSQVLADRDWWAIKYLTYFPVLASSRRNLDRERACITAFTDASLQSYHGETLVLKPAGEQPDDLWDWSFVRACAYSGAPFLERFRTRP
ncbi:MAG: hypothetical protein Q7S96_00365 [bacterium]|nr:hypothetical protein [bacterium]